MPIDLLSLWINTNQMKLLRILSFSILLLVVLTSFSRCSSTKKPIEDSQKTYQEKPSFELGDVYFQKWVSGVEGGGSGIHVYLNNVINKKNITFDSLYFRGLKGKVVTGKMGYFTNLISIKNQKQDRIMSSEPNAEYGNEIPNAIPELNDKECVISYIEDDQTKYYKFNSLKEKKTEYYPSAPPKQ